MLPAHTKTPTAATPGALPLGTPTLTKDDAGAPLRGSSSETGARPLSLAPGVAPPASGALPQELRSVPLERPAPKTIALRSHQNHRKNHSKHALRAPL